MYRQTYLEIDLEALGFNFRLLKQRAESRWFCSIVKADAYGHGATEVVRTLLQEGQEVFGVALIEEAIKLREAGFHNIQLLVFAPIDKEAVKAINLYGLTPIITQPSEIPLLENGLHKPVNVHLKVNLGMNRLGVALKDIPLCLNLLQNSKQLNLTSLCAHLSHSEVSHMSKKQVAPLLKVSRQKKLPFSLLNSPAFLGEYWTSIPINGTRVGVRLGLSLYGLKPSNNTAGVSGISRPSKTDDTARVARSSEALNSLAPVMCLKSHVVQCHRVPQGEGVSYNWTWRAKRPSLIGVIPIGYADGFNRSLSNKVSVLINHQRVPQVGAICMDYTMVNLTNIFQSCEEALGQKVELFGGRHPHSISAQELADKSGTIPYEILTCMGSRLPRKYVKGTP